MVVKAKKKSFWEYYFRPDVALIVFLLFTLPWYFIPERTGWVAILFDIIWTTDLILGLYFVYKTVFTRRFTKTDWLIVLFLVLFYGIIIYKTIPLG